MVWVIPVRIIINFSVCLIFHIKILIVWMKPSIFWHLQFLISNFWCQCYCPSRACFKPTNLKTGFKKLEFSESYQDFYLFFFSDISEWNNDYSDTLDFRRGWSRFSFWRFLITNPQCKYTHTFIHAMRSSKRYTMSENEISQERPRSASLSTNVYPSVTDCNKLCNFAFSDRRTAHFDRLSCAVNGCCSVIGWVADILCQIVDRNFMRCHWQYLQIGAFIENEVKMIKIVFLQKIKRHVEQYHTEGLEWNG